MPPAEAEPGSLPATNPAEAFVGSRTARTSVSNGTYIFMRASALADIPNLLSVEVGVEDTDLRDVFDREVVASGGLPDRLRRRCVVDAERLSPVLADI